MKNKDEKRISFREAFRLNLRMLRILYRNSPRSILSRVIKTGWEALSPYIGIGLSAMIVTELAGNRDPKRLLFLVLLTLGSALIVSLIGAWIHKWYSTVQEVWFFDAQQLFSKKLLSMDYQDIDDTHTHDLLAKIRESRMGNGYGAFNIYYMIPKATTAVCTLLGGIAMTATLFLSPVTDTRYAVLSHPLFTLGVIALMVFIIVAGPWFTNLGQKIIARHTQDWAHGNRMFMHFGFLGYDKKRAADVRMFRQERICVKYNNNKEGFFGSKGTLAKLHAGKLGAYKAASQAISALFTGVAYAYICLKAWAGAFGIGAVTQYAAAITRVAGGVSTLLEVISEIRTNAAFLDVPFEFLDMPNRMYQGTIPVEKRRDNEYEIAFHNVSFKYPGSEDYALKNVNFSFKVGKRLAVVGMNGSGKTTMIKLLCRLYDPTEGVITLNGIDIRKYNYDEYLSVFSVVFQDFKLFDFSLGQNVAAGNTVDEARIRDCLEKAGFGDRLSSLPNGIDTPLGHDYEDGGVELSGGEAQKVALARALCRDAHFIVLDEPTAALDPIAEAEVYARFDSIVGDKTAIYISHRLSSCRFCDEILVFDQGSVVQHGTHDDLLAAAGGKYHELWNAQAQYYV